MCVSLEDDLTFLRDAETTHRMETTPQDDVLIVAALVRLSYDFEDADPDLADRAWELAVAQADEHGLSPGDAVRQIE